MLLIYCPEFVQPRFTALSPCLTALLWISLFIAALLWISLFIAALLSISLCIDAQNFTNNYDNLGGRDLFISLLPHFSSSSCFFVLFHSCCSRAWMFGKTLVHEFHISYRNTEWCFFSIVFFIVIFSSIIKYKQTMFLLLYSD